MPIHGAAGLEGTSDPAACRRGLLSCFCDLLLGSLQGVQPALHLGSDVGLARIVFARAAGKFIEAIVCAFGELSDGGLGLRKNLVEVSQFLLCALGVISKAVAGLHCIDQDIGRSGNGPHSVQCVVG
jgi:hypothetical protein